MIAGDALGDPTTLFFRDPTSFRTGELHRHYEQWSEIVGQHPTVQQAEALHWIKEGVSISPHFRPFAGKFKNKSYDSQLPPPMSFANNQSCKEFSPFIRRWAVDELSFGLLFYAKYRLSV